MAAIQHAAVEQVHALGYENVTAEMIASAAGISPRTFFNYFHFKDGALIPQIPAFSDAVRVEFQSGRGRLVDDIARLFESAADDANYDRELLLKMHELALSNPRLMALHQVVFQEFEQVLTELIQSRLPRVDADKVALLAAVVAVGVRHGFGVWICTGTGTLMSNTRAKLAELTTLSAELSRRPSQPA